MEKLKSAMNASIRMGEMAVTSGDDELRTLLGSCIGLALYNRRHQIGGLAHIVLPEARGTVDRPGKFVDTAIPKLIADMEKAAGGKSKLIAKLAGGASMFKTTVAGKIGEQNIESCEQLLAELGIPIVGRHCGGEQGRRMSLHTGNGKVLIEIVGQDAIEL